MSGKYRSLIISLQEDTDIGYIPIHTDHAVQFTIDNRNDASIGYKWKYTIFEVQPDTGVMLPNSRNNFKVIFRAKEAVVVVGTIVLQTDLQEAKTFKLSAIGKYSNLSCISQPIQFGSTTVGRPVTRKVVIKNTSVVPSVFRILNEDTLESKDNPFSFSPMVGQIPAKSSFEVNTRYLPQIAGVIYNTQLKVQSQSGNDLKLYCQGESVSFDVKVTPKSINFGEVKLQNTASRAITLYNNSGADTDYQFFNDRGNIFSINDPKGTIPGNSFKKVVVLFDPKNTICYYERVYCIVRNHKLLYIDLMGTCYDLLIRPLPIVQVHVDLFRRRVIEGRLSEIDFKYLDSSLQIKISKKMQLLKDQRSLGTLDQFDIPELIYNENDAALHKQLFLDGFDNQLLTQSTDFIDFAHCDTMTISNQEEIEIRNNLSCKMTIYWILPKRENFVGDYLTTFQVYPQSISIKPGASAKFQVTFRPLKSQQFFFQDLQYFAIKDGTKINKRTLEQYEKKELKTLKPETTLLKTLKVTQTIQSKVKEELQTTQIMPPLHGVVRCVGNSFGIPSTAYIPIMQLYPSKNILFAPCKCGESTYQTVELVNNSDTPTYFRAGTDPTRVFRAFPKAGLIEGKSFQIIVLEFSPKSQKSFATSLLVHLNGSNGNPLQLSLTGICPQPKIRISSSKIFFSKCFLGVYSKQTFQIQNLSRLPIEFEAQIPDKYKDQIHLNHKSLKLESNQTLPVQICFIPQQKKQYKIKVGIRVTQEAPTPIVGYYKPGSDSLENNSVLPAPSCQEYSIEVFGEGGDGSLTLQKEEVDFGVVKVLEQKKVQLKLQNQSDCTFYIELSLKSNLKQTANHDIQNSFHLDFTEATLVAKGQTLIGITFAPMDVKNYDVQLVVSARQKLPKSIKLPSKNTSVPKCSLNIRAQGSYPLLQIVDIRNDSLSMIALWQNFQLSKINSDLSMNLNPDQKKYLNIQTLPFAESQALQNKLRRFNWNFGYLAKDAANPRRVLLTMKNFGGIELDYNFKFPFDNAIEKEIWADPGQPTKQEAYQQAIVAKNIFRVHPKIGRLNPGEVKDVEFIYTPVSLQNNKNSSQKHSLAIVLQIRNGKSLVLNLQGMRLNSQQGLVVVKKDHHNLPDTPIGMMTPLKFPIELQNVGSAKVSYKAMIKYQDKEFEEVFTISNPKGSLMPYEKDYIFCLFKPLESKNYLFKILVGVENAFGTCTQVIQITLEGKGSQNLLPGTQPVSQALEEVPKHRYLVSEIGSQAFFSLEEIDFGCMKPEETAYRMIILYNLSRESSLHFDFPILTVGQTQNSFTCGDRFAIEPSSGQIAPNDFIQLKMTLKASMVSVYEGEMECNIFWNKSSEEPSLKENNIVRQRTQDQKLGQRLDKQTLFLRIKKSSVMLPGTNVVPPCFLEGKCLLENIFSSIITTVLNSPALAVSLEQIQQLPMTVVDLMDEDQGVDLDLIDNDLQTAVISDQGLQHSNYRAMLVNGEFLCVSDLILQNTFFNIIQETTHKENDLMRNTKKFVTAESNPI